MPLWGTSTRPIFKFLSGGKYAKRKIIATDRGWVHRHTYTDAHGTFRYRDEVLVSIPRLGQDTKKVVAGTVSQASNSNTATGVGTSFDTVFVAGDSIKYVTGGEKIRIHSVTNATSMVMVGRPANTVSASRYTGFIRKVPTVVELYVANTTGGTVIRRNRVNHAYVVFDEPIRLRNNYGKLRMTIANTAGGNNCLAISNTASSSVKNANNTIDFQFKVATAGTYKIQAQSLANSATFDLLTGTLSQPNNSNTVSGIGTLFTTELAVGDVLKYTTGGYLIRVHSITNANTLVAVSRPANTVSGSTYRVKRVHGEFSLNTGGEPANLTIGPAASNALGTFSIVN